MKIDKQCMAGLFILATGILLIFAFKPVPQPDTRPEILIIREYYESTPRGHMLLVDYSVGGIMTGATYYPYQMNEYKATIAHLKRVGRLRYASPLLEPMFEVDL